MISSLPEVNKQTVQQIINDYNEKVNSKEKIRGKIIGELVETGYVIEARGGIKRRTFSMVKLEELAPHLIHTKRFKLKKTKIKKMCVWIEGYDTDLYKALEDIDRQIIEQRRKKLRERTTMVG